RYGGHGSAFAARERLELGARDAVNAAAAAHPQVAAPVLEDSVLDVVEEALAARVTREFPVLESVQPAAVRSDPEAAGRVFIEREHRVVRQAVHGSVAREAAPGEPVETAALGSDPEVTGAVLQNREHGRRRETLARSVDGHRVA